jgi:NAD(P)-dependent dehydrogenase (short-subunit alcohol dehydrogenase family)
MSARFAMHNRSAVVTGGGSGLGRAVACGFAEAGASVHVWDRDARAAAETVDFIIDAGGRGRPYEVDVTDPEDVNGLMAEVGKEGLDVLVVSAGIADRAAAVDMTDEQWHRVLDVNLTGAWNCNRAAGQVMQERGAGGSIINFASIAGLVGVTSGNANYAASKGGLIAMSRTLALEWAPLHIRVNAIAPTHIRTPLIERAMDSSPGLREYFLGNIPLGRLGEVEDIVGPAIFLASDASLLVTGHVLVVDGGHTAQ